MIVVANSNAQVIGGNNYHMLADHVYARTEKLLKKYITLKKQKAIPKRRVLHKYKIWAKTDEMYVSKIVGTNCYTRKISDYLSQYINQKNSYKR